MIAKIKHFIKSALCGFANLGSVAIQLGGIGAMVPERKQDIAKLGLWALFAGTLASYLSAAWAGLLLGVDSGSMDQLGQALAPLSPWFWGALTILSVLAVLWLWQRPMAASR